MMKTSSLPPLILAIAVSILCLGGCSNSEMPAGGSIAVSKSDLASTAVSKSKAVLDGLEQVPPASRQVALEHNARALDALKQAVATDPATKQRLESLNLHLP